MDLFDDYIDYVADQRYGPLLMNNQPTTLPGALQPNVIEQAIGSGMQSVKSEVQDKPIESAIAGVKGAAQGVVGLPGDLISLVRGVVSAIQTPDGKSKLDEFLVGLEKETLLPTTEDVRAFVDSITGPSEAQSTETLGEILSPIGTAVKGAKVGAKAIKSMKAKK